MLVLQHVDNKRERERERDRKEGLNDRKREREKARELRSIKMKVNDIQIQLLHIIAVKI